MIGTCGWRLNFWYGRRTPRTLHLVGREDVRRGLEPDGGLERHVVVLVDAVAADAQAADEHLLAVPA